MFKNKRKVALLILTVIALVLTFATVVLADDTTIMADPAVKAVTDAGKGVAILVNFLRYIGTTVILGIGYWHTFGLASSGKNANKRAQSIEALMWVAVAVVVFFGAPKLTGMLAGISSQI